MIDGLVEHAMTIFGAMEGFLVEHAMTIFGGHNGSIRRLRASVVPLGGVESEKKMRSHGCNCEEDCE